MGAPTVGVWGLRLRVWASVVLLAMVPVTVALSVGVVGSSALLTLRYGEDMGIRVLVLIVPPIVAVWFSVREVLRLRAPAAFEGLEITPDDEPDLWDEIADLADAMDVDPPDRLLLDGRANAAVTELGGVREMVIGLPLLVGLTRAELRAVIAHELGHLAPGQARLVLQAQYMLSSTVDNLDPSLARRVMDVYLRLYSRVSASVRREHEREADAWSVRLAGPDAAIDALERMRFVGLAWDRVTADYARAITARGPRGSLAEALLEVMEASAEALHAAARQRPPRRSAFDSHPSDDERIDRLDRMRGPDPRYAPRLDHPDEPAWSWLLEPNRRMAEVEAEAFAPGAADTKDWAAVLTAKLEENSRAQADRLLDAVYEMSPDAPPTIDSVLRILASGRGGKLASLVGDEEPAGGLATFGGGSSPVLAGMLTATIMTVLAEDGRIVAEPEFGPGGPQRVRFRTPDGRAYDWPFDEVVEDAVADPDAVRDLADALMEIEVDLRAPVYPDDEPEGAVRAAVSWARTTITGPARKHFKARGGQDVLVYADGLLAVRPARGDRVGRFQELQMLRSVPRKHRTRTAGRLRDLGERAGDRPAEWAAEPANQAVWVPFRLVADVRQGESWVDPNSHVLTLELNDGSRVRFQTSRASVWLNRPAKVIEAAI